jgi:dTMP kinase
VDFVVVDAGGSVEEVQGRIRREVEDGMREVEREGRPLRVVEGW